MDAITILDAPRCHLGEGPCYDPRTGIAWWVDILERRLFEAPSRAVRPGFTTFP